MNTATKPATINEIANTEILVHAFDAYVSVGQLVKTTIGKMLGADHIEFICEFASPAAEAAARASCEPRLDVAAAYVALSRMLS